MIKGILFDLDNTLIDFMKLKKKCCSASVEAMIDAGLRLKKKKALEILFELYDKYGIEYDKIFQKFLVKTIGKVDYKILGHGITAYRKVVFGYLEPYPNVVSTLIKLKGKGLKLGIVTDAPRVKAWIRLVSMKIDDFFDVVVCFEDTGQKKPGKLPFEKAIKQLNIKPSEILMIGDNSKRDVEGAKALGIMTCFARYGALAKVKKSRADYEINKFEELLGVVK